MLGTDFMLDVAGGYSFYLKGLTRKAKQNEGHAKAARVYKARVASLTSEWIELRDRVQRMTKEAEGP